MTIHCKRAGEIIELVREHTEIAHAPAPFVPGQSKVP